MFIEERILDKVSYGSQFGREFNTRIVTLKSGRERRNADWAAPLGQYSVLYELLEPEDHKVVIDAHMSCMGAAVGFRFKDWSDYEATDEFIGVGTGSEQELQLTKKYLFGPLEHIRTITKPVDGYITVYENGVSIPYILDPETGIVTFTATNGSSITWSGEFDVPVRFSSDRLDVEPIYSTSGGFLLSADVDLVEIRI